MKGGGAAGVATIGAAGVEMAQQAVADKPNIVCTLSVVSKLKEKIADNIRNN